MVPEIKPLLGLMLSPSGKALALYVSVAPLVASVAWTARLTTLPSVLVWSGSAATVTAGLTFQLKASWVLAAPSVTTPWPSVLLAAWPEASQVEELVSPAGLVWIGSMPSALSVV
jgi:hypothetical protein